MWSGDTRRKENDQKEGNISLKKIPENFQNMMKDFDLQNPEV